MESLMENFILCAVLVNQSLRLTQAIQFLCSLHYPSLSSYNKNDWLLTHLKSFQNCNFILLLFGHIYCTFKLRRSTLIKCSHVWRYISSINSNCQIFLCNNFRNMVVFSRFSLKMTNINICAVIKFSADNFVCQFWKS